MYAASRPCRAIQPRRSDRRVAGAVLGLLNGDDADAIRAIGSLDLDFLAHTVTEQGLAQGGLVADGAGLRVRLNRADDAVRLVASSILAEPHRVAHVDHAGALDRLDE